VTRSYPGLAQPDLWYWYIHGGWVEKFSVPADGQTGNYRLAVVRQPPSERTLFRVILVRNSLGTAMYRGAGDGISPGGRYPLAKRYLFHVPRGAVLFSVEFFLHAYCYNFPLRVWDPDGVVLYENNIGQLDGCSSAGDHWLTINLTADLSTQDRFWSIDLGVPISDGKPRETRPFRLVGIPPYFGESTVSSFVPTP
jgi:hypothetical protein